MQQQTLNLSRALNVPEYAAAAPAPGASALRPRPGLIVSHAGDGYEARDPRVHQAGFSATIDEVKMGIEIERKFLLLDERWRDAVTHAKPMRQGYLAAREECSVRVRLEGDAACINVKSATLGIERQEFEYPIPPADAHAMLDTLCGGQAVTKTRHYVPYAGQVWEIDEFSGANAGLVVAELELERPDQDFVRPPWLGEEVSNDPRYYNVRLLQHPYNAW